MPVKTAPSKDIAHINDILNHPEVRPWVASADEGVLNVEAQVADPNNLFLMGEFGGQMLTRITPGIYEVHTFVAPEGRGAWAMDMCWANMEYLFSRTDAYEVLSRVPETHKSAHGFAIKSGMTKEFYRPDGVLINGETVPVTVYRINVHGWVKKSPYLAHIGAEFHQWLNAEAAKRGLTNPHEPDEEHNRVIGASLTMFRGGQLVKATMLYNRWSYISRHATIKLLAVDPPEIQMDIGRVQMLPDGLRLLA